MKYIFAVVFATTLNHAFSQADANRQLEKNELSLDTIYATTGKTVAIKCPDVIGTFDVGSEDFGGEKFDKVLKLKAADENAKPTTLLIIYGDKIYHGTLAYKATPPSYFIDFSKVQPQDIPQLPNKTRVNKEDDSLKNLAITMAEKRMNLILSEPKPTYKTIVTNNESIYLSLASLLSDDQNLYLKLLFINKSKQEYKIDLIEFSYREPLQDKDLKGGYETKNVLPIVSNKIEGVGAKSDLYLGFGIPKYALTKKGELLVIVREKTGSRSLKLSIPYEVVLTCKTITKN
jgi:hypothetical protein